jgi:hypothetical protein
MFESLDHSSSAQSTSVDYPYSEQNAHLQYVSNQHDFVFSDELTNCPLYWTKWTGTPFSTESNHRIWQTCAIRCKQSSGQCLVSQVALAADYYLNKKKQSLKCIQNCFYDLSYFLFGPRGESFSFCASHQLKIYLQCSKKICQLIINELARKNLWKCVSVWKKWCIYLFFLKQK